MEDDDRLVLPDGLTVRRLRHQRSWSKREFSAAISEANFVATGQRESVTPNQLQWIEERNERVPFATLRLLALGLDCNPVDILGE